MNNIDDDNLVPTSTDMLAQMFANTDKMPASDDRWNYADHHDNKDDNIDDLDADANDFINEPKKTQPLCNSVFKKTNHNDNDKYIRSDKKEDVGKNHGVEIKNETEIEYTATDTNRDGDTKNMSKKELMLLKLDMLRKLGELKMAGVHLSQNYNLDSDFDMMQYEYKLHHDIRSKQNSVQWMSHMMIGLVKGCEMFNDNYNPFDMKLSGLSDKIGSDMHNYYAVIGDIYEKYNQPGKQMAPEMRLLLMISGAALSMQASRILPGIGGMSDAVKTEQNLNELRKKAEEDSGEKNREYVKKQHDAATQKAADIKMIQEKEIEYKRTAKLMDATNTDLKKFKENLILSSEEPSRIRNTQNRHNTKNHTRDVMDEMDEIDEYNNHRLTHAEIEHVRKMKYMEEQKHLEMLRKTAHAKSESYRNTKNKGEQDNRRKNDLSKQNHQLDNILERLDTKPMITKKTQYVSKHTMHSDSRRANDNGSTLSSGSTVSVNPQLVQIMNMTAEKAKRENINKYSEASINVPPASINVPKNNQVNPITVSNTKNALSDSSTMPISKSKMKSNGLLFDEKIKQLLASNNSDHGNADGVSIRSTGSAGNNKKKKKNGASKNTERVNGEDSSSQSSDSKQKMSDLIDIGSVSIGSRQKGEKIRFNVNKKMNFADNSSDGLAMDKSNNSIKLKQKTTDIDDFGSISIGTRNKGDKIKVSVGKK